MCSTYAELIMKYGFGPFHICNPVMLKSVSRHLARFSESAAFRAVSTANVFVRRKQETGSMNIFDRKAKRMQRNRAAVRADSHIYDYIRDEISYRLADRVYDIKRKFNVAVDLGCGKGHVGSHLSSEAVGLLYYCDSSVEMLKRIQTRSEFSSFTVLSDEEFLPFMENSVDIFISCLSLHWVNDLPGTFRQVHNALRNDGVFLGAMFGGDTLFELRCSLQLAEIEREGGFSAHVSPFTAIQDVGSLLNRAGFTMLTVDVDEIKVNYPGMVDLLYDIKGMGESNAAWNRKPHLRRETTLSAASIYKELYGNEDGTIPATFQIIYMIGWKPDSSQPTPAKRGSASVSLKDLSKLGKVIQEKLKGEETEPEK